MSHQRSSSNRDEGKRPSNDEEVPNAPTDRQRKRSVPVNVLSLQTPGSDVNSGTDMNNREREAQRSSTTAEGAPKREKAGSPFFKHLVRVENTWFGTNTSVKGKLLHSRKETLDLKVHIRRTIMNTRIMKQVRIKNINDVYPYWHPPITDVRVVEQQVALSRNERSGTVTFLLKYNGKASPRKEQSCSKGLLIPTKRNSQMPLPKYETVMEWWANSEDYQKPVAMKVKEGEREVEFAVDEISVGTSSHIWKKTRCPEMWSESVQIVHLMKAFSSGCNVGIVGIDPGCGDWSVVCVGNMLNSWMFQLLSEENKYSNLGYSVKLSAGTIVGANKWIDHVSEGSGSNPRLLQSGHSPLLGNYVHDAEFVDITSDGAMDMYWWRFYLRHMQYVRTLNDAHKAPMPNTDTEMEKKDGSGKDASMKSPAYVVCIVLTKAVRRESGFPGYGINDTVHSSFYGLFTKVESWDAIGAVLSEEDTKTRRSKLGVSSATELLSNILTGPQLTTVIGCVDEHASVEENASILHMQQRVSQLRAHEQSVFCGNTTEIVQSALTAMNSIGSPVGTAAPIDVNAPNFTAQVSHYEAPLRAAAQLFVPFHLSEKDRILQNAKLLIKVAKGTHVSVIHIVIGESDPNNPQTNCSHTSSDPRGFVRTPTENLAVDAQTETDTQLAFRKLMQSASLNRLSTFLANGLKSCLCVVESKSAAETNMTSPVWRAAFEVVSPLLCHGNSAGAPLVSPTSRTVDNVLGGVHAKGTDPLSIPAYPRELNYAVTEALSQPEKGSTFIKFSACIFCNDRVLDAHPWMETNESPPLKEISTAVSAFPPTGKYMEECCETSVESVESLARSLEAARQATINFTNAKKRDVNDLVAIFLFFTVRQKTSDHNGDKDVIVSSFSVMNVACERGAAALLNCRDGTLPMQEIFMANFMKNTDAVYAFTITANDNKSTCPCLHNLYEHASKRMPFAPRPQSCNQLARETLGTKLQTQASMQLFSKADILRLSREAVRGEAACQTKTAQNQMAAAKWILDAEVFHKEILGLLESPESALPRKSTSSHAGANVEREKAEEILSVLDAHLDGANDSKKVNSPSAADRSNAAMRNRETPESSVECDVQRAYIFGEKPTNANALGGPTLQYFHRLFKAPQLVRDLQAKSKGRLVFATIVTMRVLPLGSRGTVDELKVDFQEQVTPKKGNLFVSSTFRNACTIVQRGGNASLLFVSKNNPSEEDQVLMAAIGTLHEKLKVEKQKPRVSASSVVVMNRGGREVLVDCLAEPISEEFPLRSPPPTDKCWIDAANVARELSIGSGGWFEGLKEVPMVTPLDYSAMRSQSLAWKWACAQPNSCRDWLFAFRVSVCFPRKKKPVSSTKKLDEDEVPHTSSLLITFASHTSAYDVSSWERGGLSGVQPSLSSWIIARSFYGPCFTVVGFAEKVMQAKPEINNFWKVVSSVVVLLPCKRSTVKTMEELDELVLRTELKVKSSIDNLGRFRDELQQNHTRAGLSSELKKLEEEVSSSQAANEAAVRLRDQFHKWARDPNLTTSCCDAVPMSLCDSYNQVHNAPLISSVEFTADSMSELCRIPTMTASVLKVSPTNKGGGGANGPLSSPARRVSNQQGAAAPATASALPPTLSAIEAKSPVNPALSRKKSKHSKH